MTIQDFFVSKIFQRIMWGILIFIMALIIFELGEFVGFTKASFSYTAGDNYYRTFGDNKPIDVNGIGMPNLPQDNLLLSHGVSGKIIKIALPDIFVAEDNGVEKDVVTTDDTLIRYLRGSEQSSSLKVDDMIVVIGSPNTQGQVEAKLIRVIPSVATTTLSQ